MAKPTIIPEFASSDLTDPTSGENNVAEPTTNAKTYGWVPMLTAPFRQWMNWLHRYYYLWIKFIDDELEPDVATNTAQLVTNTAQLATNTPQIATNVSDISTLDSYFTNGNVNAKITTTYVTIEQTFAITWTRTRYELTLQFYQPIAGISNSNQLQILPVTTWPSTFIPGDSLARYLPCIAYDNGNNVAGMIKLPTTTSGAFIVYLADPTDNVYKANIFTTSGNKGLNLQSINAIIN